MMAKSQTKQQTPSEPLAYEPCPCREVVNTLREVLGISPAVRQHLTNSRVEFLKAIREIIDDRIEHLSGEGQKGTKVAVE
jgi:hypothetical protein